MTLRIATVLCLAWVLTASGANYDVYLFAGQSNMDGRGKAADLPADLRQPFTHALIWYRNGAVGTDGWKALEPGYSIAPGYKKRTLPSATFGPEIGFARAITKAQPDNSFALIKVATGGTSLRVNWDPAHGTCYRDLIATVRQATEALVKDGHAFTIRGLLWHQGEADSADTTEVYAQRLTNFITRVRADLKLPDLPVVVGEVIDNKKRDGVRQAQRTVAQTLPHVGFVPSDGFKTWDNGTHLDAASQLLLGERFAVKLRELQ